MTLGAGVVGAGVFGGYHAQKYAADPRVALIGVADPDLARAQALAERLGVRAFADPADLFAEVDLVTVASPARTHAAVAAAALEAGKHVLVEKPLAVRAADALRLAELAQARGRVVQVGHQERFVFAAMGLLAAPERPTRIESWRCNTFSPRGADVSVTLDLMTHDLDLARLLCGRAEAADVTARVRNLETDAGDEVEAVVRFAAGPGGEGGLEARFLASRIAPERRRGMVVTFPSGVVTVDFLAKTFTSTAGFPLDPDFADAPDAKDSLGASVRAFLAAVTTGAPPAVSAADGAAVVALAGRIDAAAEARDPAHLAALEAALPSATARSAGA